MFLKNLCKFILFITGWTIVDDLSYKNYPRQLVIFTHTSIWELILTFLAKQTIGYENVCIVVWKGHFVGIKGVLLNFLGCIPIENNKKSGNVNEISNLLNSREKFMFCISPEGTRNKVNKFRSGFYHIAKNTGAVYNLCNFDYENHVIYAGNIMIPSDDYSSDCKKIAEFLSNGKPLYPENSYPQCQNEIKYTSCIDYLCASNISGIANTILLFYYHHPLIAFMSLAVTISSFVYHNCKERKYRKLDWICSGLFVTSLIYYRWYIGGLWKTMILVGLLACVFIQAGKNDRHNNPRYRKWHVIYHLSTIPMILAELYIHGMFGMVG